MIKNRVFSQESIAEIVENLSEIDKRLVVLHYGRGLSIKEIAVVIKVPTWALLRRMDALMAKLSEQFSQSDDKA